MINFYEEGNHPGTDDGYIGPGFYFWDETNTVCLGPFLQYSQALAAEVDYFAMLEAEETTNLGKVYICVRKDGRDNWEYV